MPDLASPRCHRAAPLVFALLYVIAGCALAQGPEPPYVKPGDNGGPPEDATLLSASPSAWEAAEDSGWVFADGILRPSDRATRLKTRQRFRDVQIHVEFRLRDSSDQLVPEVWVLGTLPVLRAVEGAVIRAGNGVGEPPEDAIRLFDGTSLEGWVHRDGRPARWEMVDGALRCVPGTGDIMSRHRFRSAQIHVEFATPYMPRARGQGRGNSGVYVQGRYEIQVLDSYQNRTYITGQCGAIYGQYPPLVNVCRPPEQWQSYDIVFFAPECDEQGNVLRFGRMTVLHNGVVIHDDVALKGPTGGALDHKVCEPGPLLLQDHGNLVRYRNIWIRELNRPVALAVRPGKQWQSLDIVVRAPKADGSGNVVSPGRITVFHNGVLVRGPEPLPRSEGPQAGGGPLVLGSGAFEYRNVWVRPLEPRAD